MHPRFLNYLWILSWAFELNIWPQGPQSTANSYLGPQAKKSDHLDPQSILVLD